MMWMLPAILSPAVAGDFEVTVEAANRAGTDTQTFTIDVSETPSITTVPVVGATVGQPYAYDIDATGRPTPTYSLIVSPAGMTINNATGLIDWSPSANGDYDVIVEAGNAVGTDSQNYSIHVSEVPAISSSPGTSAIVGQAYTYDVDATGDPSPFFVLTTAPVGMIIDSATGLLVWTPTAPGGFDVIIEARNSKGTDTQSYAIDVSEIPVISSSPVTSATMDQQYSYDVNATGTPVPTYELASAPDSMMIDAASGQITWMPAGVGDFGIVVKAVNSAGVDGQSFVITVVGVPPLISSTPMISGVVGQVYAYDVNASGAPSPLYTLSVMPTGMTIDTVTGLIGWVPVDVGDYDVTVTAANVAGDDTQSFSIHVIDTTGPSVLVTSPASGGYFYQSLPSLTIDFSDDVGLDRAYYQIDACNGEWTELWSYNSAVADTTIVWDIPDVPEGGYGIHFKVIDDTGNIYADSCNYSWTFTYFRGSCCVGITGNVDHDPDEIIDIGDITALIDYLFINFVVPHCIPEANVDGSEDGVVDIGDLTALIDYLFITNAPPIPCE